jgi:hypothetical protein
VAVSMSSSTPHATKSLPVLVPAPPLVPDYNATNTIASSGPPATASSTAQ